MLDIKVQRIYRFETDRPLKAFCDISIGDALLIKGLRVMSRATKPNDMFIAMPREQAKDEQWYDTVTCLTQDIRDQITAVVLEAYNAPD